MARILITDDEDGVRMMMAQTLRMRGHTVVEATGAREALQKHSDQPADLIITDLVMREMDGTELFRRIRAFSATPIIAISGARLGKIYLNMAKLLGAASILSKPFAPQTLIQAVDRALTSPAPSTPSPAA